MSTDTVPDQLQIKLFQGDKAKQVFPELRIRIRIRIAVGPDPDPEGKNDPQKYKFHVLKCWIFYFVGTSFLFAQIHMQVARGQKQWQLRRLEFASPAAHSGAVDR